MKQKQTKDDAVQTQSELRQRRERALSRMRARREQQKTGEHNERTAVFRRRLTQASDARAPMTVRTRGYYRFSREFPGETDADGLRENSADKKRKVRLGLLWAAGLIAVFCLSFLLAKTAWFVSSQPPAVTEPTEPTDSESAAFAAVHVPRDAMEEADAQTLLDMVSAADGNVAVLECKDEEGYQYVYETSLLNALRAKGVKTAAYISCFKDTFNTGTDPAKAVRSYNEKGAVWTDNAGSGWLNPFSADARGLLLDAVRAAADAGFDYILLDNVCFPADAGSASAFYTGEDAFTGTRNQLLRGFISDAVAAAGKAGTILMTRYTSFDPEVSPDRAPAYGDLLNTGAGMMAADARTGAQSRNVTVNGETFADPAKLPYAFTLAVAEFALQNAGGTRVIVCVRNDDTAAEAVKAAGFAGVYGWLLW